MAAAAAPPPPAASGPPPEDQGDLEVLLSIGTVTGLEGSAYGGALFQLVWQGLGHQGQTVELPPEGGSLRIAQQWILPGPDLQPDAEGQPPQLNLALWLYPQSSEGAEEPPSCIGLAAVAVADSASRGPQERVVPIQIAGQKGEVQARLTIAIQPAGTAPPPPPPPPPPPAEPAGGAADEAGRLLTPTGELHRDPSAAAFRDVSAVELRNWTAAVLEEAVHQVGTTVEDPGPIGITDDRHFEIGLDGAPHGETLALLLDDALVHPGEGAADKEARCIPAQPIEERLVSSVCDVYLHSADHGDRLARTLREETAERLLQLINMPRAMIRRVFSDNGAATLFSLRLMQYFGMQKADPDLRARRQARQARCQSLVTYVSEETWDEWKETQLTQQLEFELPLVSLRPVPSAPDGTIDIAALGLAVSEDAAAGCTPIGVIARVGCGGAAPSDDLPALTALCLELRLWLHVEGPAVFLLGTEWAGGDALRQAARDNQLNLSVAVCEDEIPGMRRLPGFWVFSSGDGCGGLRLPQDTSPENDLVSIRWFLPAYLRLRGCGLAAVRRFISGRYEEAAALLAALKDINARAPAGGAVVAMRTAEGNPWNVRFAVVPRDHPLTTNPPSEVAEQIAAHQISLDRINLINRTLHRMVCADKDDPVFDMQDSDGVVWWCFSVDAAAISRPVIERLTETVLGPGHCMVSVSRYADAVRRCFEEIQDVQVIRRSLEHNPLELCAFRMIPQFYEAQDQLSGRDVEDINEINRALHGHLAKEAGVAPAVQFAVAESDGVAVVSCALCTTRDLSEQEIINVSRFVDQGVRWILRCDPTVQRIEGELIQRGIAVAEKELKHVNEVNERQRGIFRSVPLVGGVVSWLMPPAELDEGLRFDLTTSTLKKEGRAHGVDDDGEPEE
eukprot:TRINITY_DN70300_c0_g1_i1.p1 TRINITY_DN70300_c0_g1~~TRINITY_DN70300_c0_g1_i1.p1  ORF type:complete len:903 (+),score=304.87 TRINITY_DN70300_c0_g1_i1:98-2806(+)